MADLLKSFVISTNIIPYEGLKQHFFNASAIKAPTISTNIIPYEGLKRKNTLHILDEAGVFQLT